MWWIGWWMLVIAVNLIVAGIYLGVLRRLGGEVHDKGWPVGLAAFFAWGLLSIPLIMLISWIVPGDTALLYRTFSGALWHQIILVGLAEEFAKWAIFALVIHHSRSMRSPEDGLLMAAAVGLSFATVENVVYAWRFGAQVLLFRTLSGTIGHMTYAAIWGYVWASVTWESAGRISRDRLPYAAAAIVPAGILHGVFNFTTFFSLVVGILLKFVVLGVAWRAYCRLQEHSPYRFFPWHEADLAVSRIRCAILHNPRSRILPARLALYQIRLGRHDDALKSLDHARRRNGSDTTIPFLSLVAREGAKPGSVGWDEAQLAWSMMTPADRAMLRRRLTAVLATDRILRSRIWSLVGTRRPVEPRSAREIRRRAVERRHRVRTAPARSPDYARTMPAAQRIERKRAHLAGELEALSRRQMG